MKMPTSKGPGLKPNYFALNCDHIDEQLYHSEQHPRDFPIMRTCPKCTPKLKLDQQHPLTSYSSCPYRQLSSFATMAVATLLLLVGPMIAAGGRGGAITSYGRGRFR